MSYDGTRMHPYTLHHAHPPACRPTFRPQAQIDALDSITANPNPNAPTRPPSFAASGITAAGSSGSTSGSGSGSGNDRGVLVINEDAGSPTEEPKQDEEAAASSGSGAQQRRR